MTEKVSPPHMENNLNARPGTDRFLETDFLPLGNFQVHFTRKGAGPPLILLHGGGTWLYSFRHNIPALAKHFCVYAFDLPGHGYTQTNTPGNRYDNDLVCETLQKFMDAMHIGKAHLAGHSWGGAWAAAFAARYPDRVDKLVLLDSSGIHRFERPVWELMKYRFLDKLLVRLFSKAFVRKGLEASFHDKRLVDGKMVENIYAPLSDKNILLAQARYSRNIDWKKIRAALPCIRAKTMIVWGKNDRYIPVKYARKMQSMTLCARLEIIDQCGHSAHEEKPGRVNGLLVDFLG